MANKLDDEKKQAHELIERLSPGQVRAVNQLLEEMLDPVSRAIVNASYDDEPLTPTEEKALDEAREWFKHNKGIPHEQVMSELGINQEDIDRLKESK